MYRKECNDKTWREIIDIENKTNVKRFFSKRPTFFRARYIKERTKTINELKTERLRKSQLIKKWNSDRKGLDLKSSKEKFQKLDAISDIKDDNVFEYPPTDMIPADKDTVKTLYEYDERGR